MKKFLEYDLKRMNEMLNAREERYKFQKKINEKYGNTLISFMLNVPGIEKNSHIIKKVFDKNTEIIKNSLYEKNIDIIYEKTKYKSTGNEFFLIVTADSFLIKNQMINIEENLAWGRLLDIDVFNENMNQISREDLNINQRKCFCCEDYAKICIKNFKHSKKELKYFLEKLIRECLEG